MSSPKQVWSSNKKRPLKITSNLKKMFSPCSLVSYFSFFASEMCLDFPTFVILFQLEPDRYQLVPNWHVSCPIFFYKRNTKNKV